MIWNWFGDGYSRELESTKINYRRAENDLKSAAYDLYRERADALKVIEDAEITLNRHRDFDLNNITEVALARASVRQFSDIVNKESNISQYNYSDNQYDITSIITTLGSIGLLFAFPISGVARTVIGGAVLLSTGLHNDKKIKDEIQHIKDEIKKLDDCKSNIKNLAEKIHRDTQSLEEYLDKGSEYYPIIIKTIKSLCNDINKKFDITNDKESYNIEDYNTQYYDKKNLDRIRKNIDKKFS